MQSSHGRVMTATPEAQVLRADSLMGRASEDPQGDSALSGLSPKRTRTWLEALTTPSSRVFSCEGCQHHRLGGTRQKFMFSHFWGLAV